MRFLKNRIAQANAFKAQACPAFPQEQTPSPVFSPKKKKRPSQTIKGKKNSDLCVTPETSRATKNVVKNYGRAICNFSTSTLSLPYLTPFLQKEEVTREGFIVFVSTSKGAIDGLHNFRNILLPREDDEEETAAYKQIFKDMSEVFIKYFSVNWIFHSKIFHKEAHLKFRFKMLRRIKSPELFTYLNNQKGNKKKL